MEFNGHDHCYRRLEKSIATNGLNSAFNRSVKAAYVLFLYSDINARLIVFFIVSDIANLYRDNKTVICIVQYSLTSEFASSFKVYINRSIIKFIIINVIKYDEYRIIYVNLFLLSAFLNTAERRRV